MTHVIAAQEKNIKIAMESKIKLNTEENNPSIFLCFDILLVYNLCYN